MRILLVVLVVLLSACLQPPPTGILAGDLRLDEALSSQYAAGLNTQSEEMGLWCLAHEELVYVPIPLNGAPVSEAHPFEAKLNPSTRYICYFSGRPEGVETFFGFLRPSGSPCGSEDDTERFFMDWSSASMWSGEVLADGRDACPENGLLPETLAAAQPLPGDGIYCGAAQVEAATTAGAASLVDSTILLCLGLRGGDSGPIDVEARIYSGIGGGVGSVGCPLGAATGPLSAGFENDAETLAFSTAPTRLGNPDSFALAAALWWDGAGMEGLIYMEDRDADLGLLVRTAGVMEAINGSELPQQIGGGAAGCL